MAAWSAGGKLDGLIHHADHGSSYLAMVYTDRIVELGAKPSTGTVGDSFDNALAEAVNGRYKTELIRLFTKVSGSGVGSRRLRGVI